MTESEEAALIHRCQEKDKEAFRMLVEKYKKVMFGTAYLMTRDRGLAEDAMQEALIQTWKHLPSLRQGISLKAWLLLSNYRMDEPPPKLLQRLFSMAAI